MAKIIIPGLNEDDVIDEGNSTIVYGVLEDPDGNAVPVGNVTTATISIVNKSTGTPVVGYETPLNLIGDIDSNGIITHNVAATANDIITDADDIQFEDHVAIIAATFTSGGKTHTLLKNIRLRIMNQDYET